MTVRPLRPTVRAVFFDAVGTVIHPEPGPAEAYHAMGRRFGSQLTLEVIQHRFRAAFRREELHDVLAEFRTSEDREAARWRSIVAEVLDDVAEREACFAELFDHFGRPESWRCEPDAAEALHSLDQRGYVLGLASNYDQRLRRVATGLAALRPVRHLVISSEVGWRKPAAPLFAAVCGAVDMRPEEVLLVGDDVGNDYDGAEAAGLQAVLLDPRGMAATDRYRRIGRLGELLPLLAPSPPLRLLQ